MMNRLWLLIFMVMVSAARLEAQQVSGTLTQVKVRVLDGETRLVTPVMVCITDVDGGRVWTPSSPKPVDTVSLTRDFYHGIAYSSGENWIGPIRKMNGRGNNDDRSYVYEDLPSIPHWAEPVAYQTSGDFSMMLKPGIYKVSMEHGNEYIPIKQRLEVPESGSITETYELQRWIDLPKLGWYSGDVHVHHPTDKPEYRTFLLEYAKAEDVHLVNTLEMGHHLGTDFRQEGFGSDFRTNDGDVWLVSGQEDPRSTYGHIIGLNTNHFARDLSTYDYYDLVFRELHKQPGAVVGFAHFSWNGCDLPRGFPWYVTTEEIDFVELLQFSKINSLDYYDYLNLGFRITAAAGSDVPWGSTLGEVRTFVYTGNTFDADKWFEGLKDGRTFVSNGPVVFLLGDKNLPGTVIFRPSGATTNINVQAISHPSIGVIDRVAIYNSDGLLSESLNHERSDSVLIEVKHGLSKSQWIAAMVHCDNGAVAHTSPIYYVVDGKPTWNTKKAPDIITKQLGLIQIIHDEVLAKEVVDQGILDRLEMARGFYRNILEEIGK